MNNGPNKMSYNLGNPVADATEYFAGIELRENTFFNLKYNCACCGTTFRSFGGAEISEVHFCEECVAENKHLEYFLEQGLNAQETEQATKEIKQL